MPNCVTASSSSPRRSSSAVSATGSAAPHNEMNRLICAVLEDTRARGIRNILALRGDPPLGGAAPCSDFEYSHQLVQFIREVGEFSVGVAGFPEGHIACTEGKHVDWRRLKEKIDRGADFVITQLTAKDDALRPRPFFMSEWRL